MAGEGGGRARSATHDDRSHPFLHASWQLIEADPLEDRHARHAVGKAQRKGPPTERRQ